MKQSENNMVQKIYSGVGSIENLSLILDQLSPKSILLVTGKKSYFSSGAQAAVSKILMGRNTSRFSDFSINPSLSDAESGINQLREVEAELVIAIGGGSTIDMAKLISILAFQKKDFTDLVKGNCISEKGVPLIAIPTTSGSGSEMTHFAVVYIDKIKYSLAHQEILPNYSILDPSLTYNLSARQKAISGMDAFCQAIESYWALSATAESRSYAKKAIQILFKNLKSAICDNNKDAMEQMSYASNLAGSAINISKTTAAHAVSYALTSFHGVPHGHAVSMLLPAFIKINYHALNSMGRSATLEKLFQLFETDDAESCAEKFIKLRQDIGLSGLESLMFSEEDIVKILDSVNIERLSNNPAQITQNMIKRIFINKK